MRNVVIRTIGATAAAAVIVCGAALVSGQQPTQSIYTAAQATAGRALYTANCASCHMPDLGGRNEAPPLAGVNFMSTWGNRSTKELLEYMTAVMPPGGSSLTDEQFASIAAFIF